MKIFRHLFRFYINSSIHVALSCLSFLCLTQQQLNLNYSEDLMLFVFLGTIAAYNFVKYEVFIRKRNKNIRTELQLIIVFSAIVFIGSILFFYKLHIKTQLVTIFIVVLTLLYALPFISNTSNIRNWRGVKIYIVSLCWTIATVILPILEQDYLLDFTVLIYGVQRFLLAFVLILIFEIVDLKNDDPLLQTVPQQIGVERTKYLGFGMLSLFLALDFWNGNFNVATLFLTFSTAIFLLFANASRFQYYTSFWVEALPVFGLIVHLFFK